MGNFFKVSKIHIYSEKSSKEIKLCVLSDIHISMLTTEKQLQKIEEKIQNFHPDYICIVGDILDCINILESKERIQLIENFLKSISKVPTLIALGNHDTEKRVPRRESKKKWIYALPSTFIRNLEQLANIYVLNNKNYENEEVLFSGYTPPYSCYHNQSTEKKRASFHEDLQKQKFFCDEKGEKPSICLIHNPIYLTRKENLKILKNYDLLLAGHMHNGIVPPILDDIWKSNTGILSPNKEIIAKNARGIMEVMYEEKRVPLIISGGITKISSSSPKMIHKVNTLFPMSIEYVTIAPGKNAKKKIKSFYTK